MRNKNFWMRNIKKIKKMKTISMISKIALWKSFQIAWKPLSEGSSLTRETSKWPNSLFLTWCNPAYLKPRHAKIKSARKFSQCGTQKNTLTKLKYLTQLKKKMAISTFAYMEVNFNLDDANLKKIRRERLKRATLTSDFI